MLSPCNPLTYMQLMISGYIRTKCETDNWDEDEIISIINQHYSMKGSIEQVIDEPKQSGIRKADVETE